MSRPLSSAEESLKSRIDHPAGRHRYRGPHGDDHRVGHARSERDAAPGDVLPDEIGLPFAVLAVVLVCAVVTVLGWHAAGVVGAVIAACGVGACVRLFVRSL